MSDSVELVKRFPHPRGVKVQWDGKHECPVAPGTHIRLWFRNGADALESWLPENLFWDHRGTPVDVIAYEVIAEEVIGGAGLAEIPLKNDDNSAKKFDAAKVPVIAGAIDYFPRALMALATNSEYGFRKYGAWGGWRNVPDGQRRYTDADGRHLVMESIEGPYDAESGIAHAIMHAWNAMARVEKMLEQGEIELRRGNDIGPDGKPVPGTHRVVTL